MNHLISSHLDVKIVPMPKPRATIADKWKKRPAILKYRAFKDEIRLKAQIANFVLGEKFVAVFEIPMAPSWAKGKKEKMNGKPHRNLGDLDNFCKSIMDSLLPDQDSHVHCFFAAKFWSYEGRIRIYNVHSTRDMTVDSLINQIESENSTVANNWF